MINLDFSKISTFEALKTLKCNQHFNWVIPFYTFLKEYLDINDLIVKTSGTTGTKKSLSVTKTQMQLSAIGTINYFNLKKGSSVLLILSCDFIAGKMMLVRAIEGKLNLFIAKPVGDPSKYFTHKFDFVPLIPLQVRALIKSRKITNIRKLLVGGGKADKQLIEELKPFDILAFESFAMTETLTHFALRQISPLENEWFKTIGEFKLNVTRNGELIIRENPISGSEFKTRELVELKSESEFKWLGRTDNIINSGGVILIPEEIENKISKLISIEFVLIGLPDNKFGQKIVLVTQEPFKIEIEKLNKKLSKFEKIKEFKIIDCFPKTESGKIKRKEIMNILNA